MSDRVDASPRESARFVFCKSCKQQAPHGSVAGSSCRALGCRGVLAYLGDELCPDCGHFCECIFSSVSSVDPLTAQGKNDAAKPMWRLLPWDALADVVGVLTWACTAKAKPYPPSGWREFMGNASVIDRYDDALLRHLVEWRERRRRGHAGRTAVDSESGLPALAHAACDLLILLALDR